MNHKSKLNNKEKRASLKRIRNVGLGSAVVASMGFSGGWMRPVVKQVVLPAHAETTLPCDAPNVVAEMGPCSSGSTILATITASDQRPLQILSVPTVSATPTTVPHASGDWKTTQGEAVPANISDTVGYNVTTRGQVMLESVCTTPATAVPNSGGVPLTRLDLTVEYLCVETGDSATVTVDLLTLI